MIRILLVALVAAASISGAPSGQAKETKTESLHEIVENKFIGDEIAKEQMEIQRKIDASTASFAEYEAKKAEEARLAELERKRVEDERIAAEAEELARMAIVEQEPAVVSEPEVQPVSAIDYLSMELSAYTAFCAEGCTGVTRMGDDVSGSIYFNDSEYGAVRIVAADTAVLPMNSIIDIPGIGISIVRDTGGYIVGNRLDILVDSTETAINFGRQNDMPVKVLRFGN